MSLTLRLVQVGVRIRWTMPEVAFATVAPIPAPSASSLRCCALDVVAALILHLEEFEDDRDDLP